LNIKRVGNERKKITQILDGYGNRGTNIINTTHSELQPNKFVEEENNSLHVATSSTRKMFDHCTNNNCNCWCQFQKEGEAVVLTIIFITLEIKVKRINVKCNMTEGKRERERERERER
jgi:hypothetical protein